MENLEIHRNKRGWKYWHKTPTGFKAYKSKCIALVDITREFGGKDRRFGIQNYINQEYLILAELKEMHTEYFSITNEGKLIPY
jgi:hypothetical protein